MHKQFLNIHVFFFTFMHKNIYLKFVTINNKNIIYTYFNNPKRKKN